MELATHRKALSLGRRDHRFQLQAHLSHRTARCRESDLGFRHWHGRPSICGLQPLQRDRLGVGGSRSAAHLIQSFLPNALRVGNESKNAVFKWNMFVFAVGTDFNLYVDTTSDATPGTAAVWNWDPLGAPPGTLLGGLNGAVSSTEVEATLASVQMFVFVSDDSGDVHLNQWDGSKWTWHDQLGPP